MSVGVSVLSSMPGTLGVAVAVQYVVFLWIMVEGHHPKKETTNTTAAPINTTLSLDNSSHEVDGDTNGTWNWPNWASEDTDDDSNIFSNKGVLNAIIGGVVAVVMIAIYAARYYYRKRHPRQPTNLAAPPPPYQNGTSQPTPQTWNLQSMAGTTSTNGSAPTTVQPASVFSTTSSVSSGINYSNNNFLSNYSSASDYSCVARL